MFRITRGHSIQHGPSFPGPAFRFPDDTPLPIYSDDEHAEESAAVDEAKTDATDPPSTEPPA